MAGRRTKASTAPAVIAAIGAALALKTFVLDVAVVEGGSMRPALDPGRAVLLFRAAYGLRLPGGPYLVRWARPRPGEVVAAEAGGRRLVKRVAATGPAALPRSGGGAVAVAEGFVFLIGDAPEASNDSRDYGPLPLGAVEGRILGIGAAR